LTQLFHLMKKPNFIYQNDMQVKHESMAHGIITLNM
jgi:hypothetical protein